MAAFLIVLGIGAVAKNLEFVGSQYMKFTGATMLSEGDYAADIGTVLQRIEVPTQLQTDMLVYDYQWDMLANTLGALLALGIIAILWRVDKEYLKERTIVHEG